MRIRIITLLASLFMASITFAATELTPAQKAFQDAMKSFLREEGFSPSVDEDNSLTFKKEGVLYWIDILDSSPFYVEFHRIGLKCDDSNRTYVLEACNESNRRVKCVKSILKDDYMTLVIESFCHSVEEFKYTFYKSLSVLGLAYEVVKDTYNELDNGTSTLSAPFQITKVEVANVEKDNSIINDFGSSIYDFQTKYLKSRITVDVKTPGQYDVYVKLYTPNGLSSSSSSPEGYTNKTKITMTAGTHTYDMTGWGNDVKGNWKEGSYRFEFYYQGQLLAQKAFNVK